MNKINFRVIFETGVTHTTVIINIIKTHYLPHLLLELSPKMRKKTIAVDKMETDQLIDEKEGNS